MYTINGKKKTLISLLPKVKVNVFKISAMIVKNIIISCAHFLNEQFLKVFNTWLTELVVQ